MQSNDNEYRYLLDECQAAELERRLYALERLYKYGYLERVPAQFLLDRLNATSIEREQSAILDYMRLLNAPLPVEALMTMLADRETSTFGLRMGAAHTLAFVRAEESLDLLLQLLHDPDEEIGLREVITWDLALWGERISNELVLALLANPERGLCAAALDVIRGWPAHTIPLETILPYCTHEERYIREAAIKTVLAAERRVPLDPIFAALHDPEVEVRTAASHGCIDLVEWFGEQMPLEPLIQGLSDEYPPVREDLLDALGKVPHRAPVEPVIAALADSVYYVRCAAVETLGLMGERVPPSVYPVLQDMSGFDAAPQVRQRATRTLLLLHGLMPEPLRLPIFDPTLEELGE